MEARAISETENFHHSGPSHLTAVNWENIHHRRSVAASLVQGVYILEQDRQQNPQGHQSHAYPWWFSFHFQLISPLIDAVDSSIFGAIYQYNSSDHNAPKYVIAFRGTLIKLGSMSRDFELDIKTFRSKLHEDSRLQHAMQVVQDAVKKVGAENIWLAGHSLGSAIALVVGKNMTRLNNPIKTYLFNPPFISVPADPMVKDLIRTAKSFAKAGIAVAVEGQHHSSQKENSFFSLSNWVPHLFVNSADHISSGYIGYFEHRKKMGKVGLGQIERVATQNSIRDMIFGGREKECEALHLLPSADLTINMLKTSKFRQSHGIQQWWDQSFHGRSECHQLW